MPAMSVSCVQEVQLTPGKLSQRRRERFRCRWLRGPAKRNDCQEDQATWYSKYHGCTEKVERNTGSQLQATKMEYQECLWTAAR